MIACTARSVAFRFVICAPRSRTWPVTSWDSVRSSRISAPSMLRIASTASLQRADGIRNVIVAMPTSDRAAISEPAM